MCNRLLAFCHHVLNEKLQSVERDRRKREEGGWDGDCDKSQQEVSLGHLKCQLSEKVFLGAGAWRMSKNFGFNKFDTKIEFRFWAIVSLARWAEGEEWKSAAFGYSGNLILLEITIPNPGTKVSNENVTKQPLWSVDCVHSTPFLVYKRLFCKFSRPFCLITSFQLVWASL